MARANRRNNIAAMEGGDDSDDEPVVRRGKRPPAPSNSAPSTVGTTPAADSSDDELPAGPSFRAARAAKTKKQDTVDAEDEEPPSKPTRKSGGAVSSNGKKRRDPDEDADDSPPPSPKSKKRKPEPIEDAMDDPPDEPDAESGGAGWAWVTSKFFNQDERILERWNQIDLPPRTTRNLDVLARFKALCMKNATKWIRGGIAFEKRTPVWELLAQVRVYGGRLENPINYYKSLVQQAANISPKLKKDIKADITRTMQEHAKFKTKQAQNELDRILSAYCVRNPAVGYCQSMSHIVGFLMLFYGEESCFWFLCTLIDHYLPPDFYAPSLLGVRVETEVFARLVEDKLSKLAKHFRRHEIDLRVVSLKWFMCFFLLTLPMEAAARVWDVLLLEGSQVLLSFALALLDLNREELLSRTETSEILECLNKIGMKMSSGEVESFVKKATDKFLLKEKDIHKLRLQVRPYLEKEYVSQLQTMESRRAEEERARLKAEVLRLKVEKQEEAALEVGTDVTKIPKNAMGFWSRFYKNSQPKRVHLTLKKIVPKGGKSSTSPGGSNGDANGASEEKEAVNLTPHGADGFEDDSKAAEALKAKGPDEWIIEWTGSVKKSKDACRLPLNEVQLVLGCTAGVFATNSKVHEAYKLIDFRCASFLFPPDASIGRTNHSFDIVFDDRDQLDAWVKVLKRTNILRIKVTSTSTPEAAEAAAHAALEAAAAPPAVSPSPTPAAKPAATPAASPKKGTSTSAPPPNAAVSSSPPVEDAEPEESRKSRKKRPPVEAVEDGEEEEQPKPRRKPKPRDEDSDAEELDLRDL